MKTRLVFVLFLSVVFLLFFYCKRVPVTGRKQVNLISASQMLSLSNKNYNQVLEENEIVKDNKQAKMVKSVGQDIANAAEEYLKERNKEERLENYNWEFNLIKNDETKNAWAMPGGKVAFYTGILPVCKDKNGIAVVMGHEIAHAVARHGNERMSQQLALKLGGMALSVALSEKPQITQDLFRIAYGIGSQLGVLLPYSRLHESEADKIGLIFMAKAGYNPKSAPKFWKRMKERSAGSPPAFLSTHPPNQKRINELKEYMPKAMRYYKK